MSKATQIKEQGNEKLKAIANSDKSESEKFNAAIVVIRNTALLIEKEEG